MDPVISSLFGSYRKKNEMLRYFKDNSELFPKLIEASLIINNDKAWRCALLVGHLITKNDNRIKPFVNQFITKLPKALDGNQRQILVILDKMQLSEDQEGQLFNYCLTIWEDIKKIPSTRMRAFCMMEKISSSYPELKKELRYFVTPYYTETLSPGIKHSIIKRYQEL